MLFFQTAEVNSSLFIGKSTQYVINYLEPVKF